MAISSLAYTAPIRRHSAGKTLDYHLLETAAEQFTAGDHLASVQTVFRHLFPDGEPPDLATPFRFSQGSSRVSALIDDGVCFLTVPVARLPSGGGAVAALRYVLTRINASGQLYQARLHGDDVVIEYSERLSALHPQKLVEVLRRMPVEADEHDDWMISQFGMTPLDRGEIEPLDDAALGHADEFWRAHWAEIDELLKLAQRKRSRFFLNELTALAVYRVRFVLPLAGSVLPRLLESAATFNDCDVDPLKREAALAKCIREMKALSRDELSRSLGHVEHAISPYSEGTPARLRGFLGPGDYQESIEKYQATGHSMEAATALISTYHYLLALHTWPDEVAAELQAGLAAASGKPWREAAALLIEHASGLVAQYCDDDEDGDDDEADDEDGDDDEDDEANDEDGDDEEDAR